MCLPRWPPLGSTLCIGSRDKTQKGLHGFRHVAGLQTLKMYVLERDIISLLDNCLF